MHTRTSTNKLHTLIWTPLDELMPVRSSVSSLLR